MDKLTGLTRKEVEIRKEKNLVNYDTTVPTKSIKQIISSNIFTSCLCISALDISVGNSPIL